MHHDGRVSVRLHCTSCYTIGRVLFCNMVQHSIHLIFLKTISSGYQQGTSSLQLFFLSMLCSRDLGNEYFESMLFKPVHGYVLQIVHYDVSQQYREHYDYFGDDSPGFDERLGSQVQTKHASSALCSWAWALKLFMFIQPHLVVPWECFHSEGLKFCWEYSGWCICMVDITLKDICVWREEVDSS